MELTRPVTADSELESFTSDVLYQHVPAEYQSILKKVFVAGMVSGVLLAVEKGAATINTRHITQRALYNGLVEDFKAALVDVQALYQRLSS